MTKPTNPNITIPSAFAINGQKTDFLEEKIETGFDPVDPDVLAGDNLNKLIDDTYKGLHYTIDGVSDLYKGVVLYDETETYNSKSIVFYITENEQIELYKSIVDDNLGNELSDTTKWKKVDFGGTSGGFEIGMPVATLSDTLAANEIWLEGAEVSRTDYPLLFEIYGTTYGAGDESTTFALPDLRNRVLWGSETYGYVEAGLPNITGYIRMTGSYVQWASGAFTPTESEYQYAWGNTRETNYHTAEMNASRCSAVYGKSSTVQPPAVRVRFKTRFE